MICCRFGIHGLRVFQTLLMRGQLEQKQVADTVMQPHKETRELLYRMLRAGYVQMQVGTLALQLLR
jgi:DNA-directed RNA polymerase III subunit RPC3